MKNALNPLSIKKYFKDQKPPDLNQLRQTKKKFTDPYFPPTRNSFISCDSNGYFIDKTNGPQNLKKFENNNPGKINRIVWKRATEIYKKWNIIENKIERKDISQGSFGDCYFLTALFALTRYQYLIIEKFRTKTFNEEGYYEMIFFIDGEWQVVFVDDYFPIDSSTNNFFGAKPHNNELWAILLEKAWVKINGGYINAIGGLFSEVILSLTGFPTDYHRHKDLKDQKDIFNLYRNIELGHKEGSIMSCGSKDDQSLEKYGLVPNHAYSIVYPTKWDEKKVYLIKLGNPWGTNDWKGNWSDSSPCWTKEFINYFKYTRQKDGTLYIDLNDYIYFFGSTCICHLLYGALVKYFYFEYQSYFKSPAIFNLVIKEKANTSISILYKKSRFNRELGKLSHPFSLVLCKYNQNRRIEKIWNEWNPEDELNIVEILEAGYYCIWLYCPINHIKGDPNFKYILQISSLSHYEIEFIGLDHDFSFIQYLVTDNFKVTQGDKINSAKNFLIEKNDELFKNGLSNILIYNKNGTPMEVELKFTELTNLELFPPYRGMNSFKIMIPAYENAAVLGIELAFGISSYNYSSQIAFKNGNESNYKSINMGQRFENYLKFNISSDSPANNGLRSEEYKFVKRDLAKKLPIFNSTAFVGTESLKQSMMITQEISPQDLLKNYPNEFKLLFENYKEDYSPNIKKKWTKLRSPEGKYVGQINISNGELEGRAVFFWNTGLKYIGYFSRNALHGKGFIIDKNNKCIFKGHFYQNKKNGPGYIKYENGDCYQGNLVNDKLEGNGNYYYANGVVWEGTFKNDMKHGVGIVTKKNGEIYLMEYENDNYIGGIRLNNEEKQYIENLRQKDRKIILEKKKSQELNKQNSNNTNNTSIAAFNLYYKKRGLTSSIKVYK